MKWLLAFYLFIFLTKAYTQNTFRNGVYLEIGGNAGYYSINYERDFSRGIIGRIGFSGLQEGVIIPLLAGKYFGKGSHHFEIMAGIGYGFYTVDPSVGGESYSDELLGTAFLGYRYQNPEKRILFRAGYTPFFSRFLTHWGGISLGYRF